MFEIVGTEGPIRFRPAADRDLVFILSTETGARKGGFVLGWSESEHREALRNDDVDYWIVEADPDGRSVGYVILQGRKSPHGSIELKRVALAETDKGYGRHALRLVKRLAFESLGAHRLWLDVFEHNARARHLYSSVGFIAEGTLRESMRLSGGYASLVVMSMLEHEYLSEA